MNLKELFENRLEIACERYKESFIKFGGRNHTTIYWKKRIEWCEENLKCT